MRGWAQEPDGQARGLALTLPGVESLGVLLELHQSVEWGNDRAHHGVVMRLSGLICMQTVPGAEQCAITSTIIHKVFS